MVAPYSWRPFCRQCGGRVMVFPGYRAKAVVCMGIDPCEPCCAECGTPLVLREGDYDGDCDHQPAISGDYLRWRRERWY